MFIIEYQLTSLKDAMKILNIGDTKIREIIHTDPTFPAFLIGGRWKVDKPRLYEWINNQRAFKQEKTVASTKQKKKREKGFVSHGSYEVNTPGWKPRQNSTD